MCLLTTNQAPCDHAECKSQTCCFAPLPCFPETASSALLVGMLHLHQLLRSMASQSAAAQTYLDSISSHLTSNPYQKGFSSDLDFRYPDDRTYRSKLGLVGETVGQVFKERGFALTVQIVGNDELPRRAAGQRFKVCLYSQDNPPKRILQNISGKKILRGTIEAESDSEGLVKFTNIVVNEVSSHYMNDAFYLVVQPASPDIKPFTLDSFSVRARKPTKRSTRPGCSLEDLAA